MKRNWLVDGLLLVPAVLVCGCSTMSNTEKGVGVGGGLTGHAIDESERRTAAQVAAAGPPRGPLGITDVVQLAQAHVSDDVIVSQIRSTGSVYHLSANDTI